MSQHLWDNACILKQNSPIYDPYLSSKGIKTLKDAINGKGNNRKWEYMSDKYQLTCQLFVLVWVIKVNTKTLDKETSDRTSSC